MNKEKLLKIGSYCKQHRIDKLGYSLTDFCKVTDNNIKNVVHPDDYNLLRAGVNLVKHRASGINTVELRLTMKNGNLRLITMGIKAVTTVTFGEMAYVFIITDKY